MAHVTDIYQFGHLHAAANMDFQRQKYRFFWHSDWQKFADFGSCPQVPDATVA